MLLGKLNHRLLVVSGQAWMHFKGRMLGHKGVYPGKQLIVSSIA
jgi:hypothetical protein